MRRFELLEIYELAHFTVLSGLGPDGVTDGWHGW
jgi:hypothetical protein